MTEKKVWSSAASIVLLTLAVGCGGAKQDQGTPAGGAETAPANPAATRTAPATDAGRVVGVVAFEGEAPKVEKIKMKADQFCNEMHPDGMASQSVEVENGKLANVFLWIKDYEGPVAAPTEPVVVDQTGCTYSPHVFGVQVGQTLEIRNSDETLHNVHALPVKNAEFNLPMPQGQAAIEQTFTKPEMMVKFKCDVHPWMSAYCGVMANSLFAVSAADGSFSISGLPPGDYTVGAWHEVFGTKEMKVTVPPNGEAEADFSFNAKSAPGA